MRVTTPALGVTTYALGVAAFALKARPFDTAGHFSTLKVRDFAVKRAPAAVPLLTSPAYGVFAHVLPPPALVYVPALGLALR